ncbi:MAG: DUF2974 domain-containing protein [Lachnospiraceae bacterium]|nr:DUF2974 domain-containing protein [Lachnospiraceae bacterium]
MNKKTFPEFAETLAKNVDTFTSTVAENVDTIANSAAENMDTFSSKAAEKADTFADKIAGNIDTFTGKLTEKITEAFTENGTSTGNSASNKKDDLQYTMIHYAKTCRASFGEEPFNEADSLILSWLSYLCIPERVLPKRELGSPVKADNSIFTDTDSCRIRDLLKYEYFEDMLKVVWSPDETLDMLYAMALSPRFESIRICMRREELDPAAGKQFAAMTFQILPDLTYIAFRGTDKTMTGWEEDLRLCLEDPVPAQLLAAEYLTAVGQVFRGKLLVGGHSKGGNLAVYAAANCSEEVQERIRTVYSHDGPGFLSQDLESPGFKRIRSRIQKTVPQFSVFGMLLLQETEPKIVYSYEKGIMQHNAASWKIDGYGLSEYRYPDKASQVLTRKLNNWVNSLTQEEKKIFIDTVFHILNETGLEKFGDLKTNLTIIPVAFRELQNMDPSMRQFLFDLVRQLILASGSENETNISLDGTETVITASGHTSAISETSDDEPEHMKRFGDADIQELMKKYVDRE